MKNFIGRDREIALLRTWQDKPHRSTLTAIYGRRRIGKTRLVEETYKNSFMLQFEGLERGTPFTQKDHFLKTFSRLTKENMTSITAHSSWEDILIFLSEYLKKKPTIIFFDEFQWMAGERQELVSIVKFVWDNYFVKNNCVHLILCGSVSSFIVKKVIHSKALYGRIDTILELSPLSFHNAWHGFMNKRNIYEALEYYMVVGGVPKYLELYNQNTSTMLNLKNLCFSKSGYLYNDVDRLFVSHFGKVKHYRTIVKFCAERKSATREEIINHCGMISGGRISKFLEELELAQFIESYHPVSRNESERLKRYRISDPYVRFYYKFIYPQRNKIKKLTTDFSLEKVLPQARYDIWRGLAFEYLCLTHADKIAKALDFAAVNYEYGSWFSRHDQKTGFQIDPVFIRADRVITICEIKYKNHIGKEIIKAVEEKIKLFPNPKQYTIEKVLISALEPSKHLSPEGYFSRILTVNDLFL